MAPQIQKLFSVRRHAGLLFLLFLVCVAGNSFVQGANVPGDYLTDVWTSENGLPDNSVTAIAQTPDGYLWIGTYNGLSRFDGVRFVTFDPANTPALQHARIRRLYVDEQGTLWINTYDGSLTTYRQGKFTVERHNTQLSEGELTPVFSSSNQVVFLMSRGELFRKSLASPPEKGWEQLTPPRRGLGAIGCEDGEGTIWYRDGDQHLWQVKDWKFGSSPYTDAIVGTNVNYLTTDSNGRLWIGTDDGLAFWDGKEFQSAVSGQAGSLSNVTALSISASGQGWLVAGGYINPIFGGRWAPTPDSSLHLFADESETVGLLRDHRGGMWFYSYGNGLVHAGASGNIHQLTAADGLPSARVFCAFEDREGNLWAGLDAGGLVRVRAAQFHAIDAGEEKAAKTVCEDTNRTVWIGLLSGGLNRWRHGQFTNISIPESGAMDSVFCLCPDDAGRFWASAGNEDLYFGTVTQLSRVAPVIHGVKVLFRDHRGRVWIGTTSGLYFSDAGPDGISLFKGMARHSVRALSKDKNGTLWAGSGNGNLYHIVNDAVTALPPTDNQESGAVWSVLADDDGTIWVGTFRGGLLRFRDGKFSRYGKAQGLPDNVICQILDDGYGNLWLGSHLGVFRVAKKDLDDVASGKSKFLTCTAYGRSDGLPSSECSGGFQPSACRDGDGRLWFTTARGAAWIQPEDVQPNLTPPPVVIEEVLVDGRIQTNLQTTAKGDVLNIPPGKHQVEIYYTGLSLVSPERVQFRYRLEGVNDEWVQAGTQRFAQYSFLPPGDYLFHVLACNSDGVWSDTGSSLRLHIRPHFYETWWFETLAVVAVLGVMAGTIRQIATRRLRLRMQQLERHQAVERERARIARDIHDDLGASLNLIAVLGDLATKEKTSERIEKMSGTAREAVKSLDEIVWAVNPRNDTLSHLVDYTCQFASGYLRDAGIRCLLDVPEQMPAREVQANVRHNVFLVVKEALQNIVKHAHATEAWLRISVEGNKLKICIEDNGCGFNGAPTDTWADGLRNMQQRLTEVNGSCRIQSQAGAGTSIILELPFP
ncbi:MAG TPA: two-component regulator propeller domain-containing protein [Pseudomonadales bacterium]|nr:two-component regulator propeller domain-containing protein [Pseudomonadales bacterium]